MFSIFLFPTSAFAQDSEYGESETLVYIHGWTPYITDHNFNPCQDSTDCSRYWDSGQLPGNVRHVGWNPAQDDWRHFPVNQTVRVLNEHCRGNASCSIVCHSTGCPIAARTLDVYGNGGASWNINRVLTLGSAEGGTELGDVVSSTPGMALLLLSGWTATTLQTGFVRSAYDHNNTAGVTFFHVAGYDGGSYGTALIIAGQDDGVVPFHSACGYVKAFGATQCSNDWEWVRKTSFGVPYYVMRTVARWTNHTRVEYCGRDGCDKTHSQIKAPEFQALVRKANP
jgi:hypothetical protein